MSDQLDFLIRQLPNLLWGFPGTRPGGLVLSVALTAVGLLIGLGLAVAIGLAHHSRLLPLRVLARTYVRVFRGIPLVVLLVLVHQFTATGRIFGLETSALQSALIALTLYSSAYQGDLIHTGIGALPQQLIDDARLLGAGRVTLTRTVVLPYALRTMRPALDSQAVTVFKDSSVVVVLGVADLTTNARIALGADVGNAPYWLATYLVVGALYFFAAFGITALLARFPRPARTIERSRPPSMSTSF